MTDMTSLSDLRFLAAKRLKEAKPDFLNSESVRLALIQILIAEPGDSYYDFPTDTMKTYTA